MQSRVKVLPCSMQRREVPRHKILWGPLKMVRSMSLSLKMEMGMP